MKGTGHGRTLVWHLAVFGAALLVPAFAFVAVLMWQVADSERTRTEADARQAALNGAAAIDREISGYAATIQILATDPSLQRADLASFDRRAREALRVTGADVVLRDRAGRQLVNTRVPYGDRLTAVTLSEIDQLVLARRQPVVSDLIAGVVADALVWAVAVPVLQNDEVVYFLDLSLSPERVLEVLRDKRWPEAFTITVLDGRNAVVAHSGGAPPPPGSPAPPELLGFEPGTTGDFIGKDATGRPHLVGYAHTRMPRWTVLASVPQGTAEAALTRTLVLLASLGLLLLALASILAITFGRRAASAVADLRAAAADLGAGEPVMPPVTPVREVNEVGETLSAAAIGLREREAALRASEERLRLALEGGRLGTWELDLGTGRRRWSPRTEAIFGIRSEELGTCSEWEDFVHQEDRERIRHALADAIAGNSTYETEFRIVRRDGEMRWVSSQALVLRDSKGVARRVIGVHRDITDDKRREADLQRSNELLRLIGETTPDPIFVKDTDCRFLFANPAMGYLLGCPAGNLIGRTGFESRPEAEEVARVLAHDREVLAKGVTQCFEETYRGPSGIPRVFLSTKTPLRDPNGAIIGLIGVATDITDRKRAEERQALMVRELHHRVKNSLATVQAIANSTARTATDIASFREAFNDRVMSLARTHTLLAENSWGMIPLRELVETELRPYAGESDRRFTLEGPEIALPSDVALALGMAVHELTTNAVKHGALSVAVGSLTVRWTVESVEGARRLRFTWTEAGGPRVAPPAREGFGSRLLRHTLGGQLKGDVHIDFHPDGLRFTVRIPLVEEADPPAVWAAE